MASADRSGQPSWSSREPGEVAGAPGGVGTSITAQWLMRGDAMEGGVEGRPDRPEHEGPEHPAGRSLEGEGDSVARPNVAGDPGSSDDRRRSR
jgi:hypothetical protein